MKELADRCLLADGGLSFINDPEHLQNRFFPDTPGAAIGAILPDGRLGACVAIHLAARQASPRATISGLVLPALRGSGIGSYLMDWSQAQARAMFSNSIDHPWTIQIRTESLTEPEDCLYRAYGFTRIFEELVMRRDLDQPLPAAPIPSDLTLSNWQPDLAEKFFQAYELAFRERPGFPGLIADEWISGVTGDDYVPEWTLLALAGDVPAGFIIGTIVLSARPPGGYISQIGVIPAQRRRGLASALMVEAMRRMQSAGIPWTELAVHLNNPGAIQAYQRSGFETIGRRAKYERTG